MSKLESSKLKNWLVSLRIANEWAVKNDEVLAESLSVSRALLKQRIELTLKNEKQALQERIEKKTLVLKDFNALPLPKGWKRLKRIEKGVCIVCKHSDMTQSCIYKDSPFSLCYQCMVSINRTLPAALATPIGETTKVKKTKIKKAKRKGSIYNLQGSVQTGLVGVTSGRNWKHTK